MRRIGDQPGLDAAALDDVVITGGSGAIGLQYARYCLERGARTVTLLSRTGVDPAALRELADGHGAEVRAPQCDITDRAALASVAATHAGSGASLLIHTAGIAQARSRADLTGVDVAAVCDAKVRGLALMAEVWPLRPDCRILACSSVFGTWGGYGHAAYAASNRMLDVLAAQLRADGRDCTAIRWGLWQGAGVVVGNEITRTERSGLVAMEPEAAIEASLHRYDGDPLIFDADFDRLQVFFESQGMPMPFSASHSGDGGAKKTSPSRSRSPRWYGPNWPRRCIWVIRCRSTRAPPSSTLGWTRYSPSICVSGCGGRSGIRFRWPACSAASPSTS